jgi:hypothetical protein
MAPCELEMLKTGDQGSEESIVQANNFLLKLDGCVPWLHQRLEKWGPGSFIALMA